MLIISVTPMHMFISLLYSTGVFPMQMLSSSPESPPARKRMRVKEIKKKVKVEKKEESSDEVRKEKEPLRVCCFFSKHFTVPKRLCRHMENV